jgi:tetratricopeptide (TPR) repeat protein
MNTRISVSRMWLRAACAGTLLVAAHHAPAAGIPGYPASILEYDAREVAMLPQYCVYTQDFRARIPGRNNLEEIRRWRAKMGNAFEAMHHYCWGLMETNRAVLLTRSPQDRNFYLTSAISNFDYVIQNSPANFVLLPEILTKKGENLIRLGRGAQGVLALEQAISLKPDYWPPYAVIGDYYKESGNVAKAREVLDRGLTVAPEAKGLRRRLAELNNARPSR